MRLSSWTSPRRDGSEQFLSMAANSPSSQVPYLKSTALAPLTFPSPPHLLFSNRAFISLHKDNINKLNSSVGHTSQKFPMGSLVRETLDYAFIHLKVDCPINNK